MNDNNEVFFENTGEICTVFIKDDNRDEGFRSVDLGNFFRTPSGEKVLITSRHLADKYGHLVKENIYVPRRKIIESM